jgi:SAM-dependent methyltransferase
VKEGKNRRRGRRALADAELGRALDLLEQRRAPYAELLAEIVADTLARFPPLDGQPVVEIGAGSGQLRAWLPPALAGRTIHTDPSRPALHALRARDPAAITRVAKANKLPFSDRACGAVVGLCVFDAVGNEKATVAEIARVLAPGGRFVHFLDMATLLEAPFARLATSGLVPIPNVLGDPGDSEWPLDIVLIERSWLAGLLDFTRSIGHPLAATFGPYFALHLAGRVDVDEAAKVFKQIASSGEGRHALMSALVSASRLALDAGHPAPKILPFHSGQYAKSVLDTSFTESGAFEIELSDIVARSLWKPSAEAGGVRYRSLCVGHQRILDALPGRLLTSAARAPNEGLLDGTLVEAGVFVFVARRLPCPASRHSLLAR